jgi:hypothetical protein
MFFEEVKVRIQLEMNMIQVREVRNSHPLDVLLFDSTGPSIPFCNHTTPINTDLYHCTAV